MLVLDNEVALDGRLKTWRELQNECHDHELLRKLNNFRKPVAFIVSGMADAYRTLAYIVSEGLDGLLISKERASYGVRDLIRREGYSIVDLSANIVEEPRLEANFNAGRISLLTSGSTGLPKIVSHRWDTLYTGEKIRNTKDRTWLLPYQVGTYAWYQIVTLGLFQKGQKIVPGDARNMEELFELGVRFNCNSISATPTFWRIALLKVHRDRLRSVPLESITLGGEVVDQDIIDQLKSLFPTARVVHIYASTEAGACLIVKDGLAGFPACMIDRHDEEAPKLKISDGRLFVKSKHSSMAARNKPDEWIDTGDLVERRGDRIFFIGRADNAILNIGGNKAYPADIEAIILRHPSIAWCKVRGVKAPIVGQLVQADYVCRTSEKQPTEPELTEYCKLYLPDYAVPRLWNQLSAIPVMDSLKTPI